MRRTVSRAPRAASWSRPRRSATASGSDRTSGRTAPSCIVSPASVGPTPSWRSRRSRCRSSSRATTSRCRPARRASVSSAAWTATPPCRPRSASRSRSSLRSLRPGATVMVPIRSAPDTRSTRAVSSPATGSPQLSTCPPASTRLHGTRSDAATVAARPDRTASTLGAVSGLLGQPLQCPVRIAQVAVEQAVHHRGQPHAHGMDREGRAARDHGDAEIGQVVAPQPEHRRHQDRETGDHCQQHRVDEGLPDDHRDRPGAPSQDRRGELRGQQRTGDDVERLGRLRPEGMTEDHQQHERRGRQEDADHAHPLVRPRPAQPNGVRDEAEHERHLEQDRVHALEPRPDAARQQAQGVGDLLQPVRAPRSQDRRPARAPSRRRPAPGTAPRRSRRRPAASAVTAAGRRAAGSAPARRRRPGRPRSGR